MNTSVQTIDLIRHIFSKSVMLFEKLEFKSQWIALEDKNSVDKYLDMWKKVLSADGETEKLNQFMEIADLSSSDTEFMLSQVISSTTEPLPTWAKTLARVLNNLTGTETVVNCLEKDNAIPFEEIYLPFVKDFKNRITGCLGERRLSPECHKQIQRKLLQLLSDYTANTFYLEFQVFKTHNSSFIDNYNNQSPNIYQKLYQQFVKEFWNNRYQVFFTEYAMIGRILGTLTNLWYEAIREFIEKLDTDWSELETTFNHGNSLGIVNQLYLSLSDRHCGGRSVIALEFTNGQKLVYKPKKLAMEAGLSQVLDWLNHQKELSHKMKVMKVLDKNSYGWVEFIESVECQDNSELEAFYYRTGILLGLGYMLEATDLHHENIIAHGAYPVMIDCETLLQHRANLQVSEQQRNTANSTAMELFSNSVLRSHLLPDLVAGKNNSNLYDMSALGSFTEQKIAYDRLQWKNINTDRMLLEQESHQILPVFPSTPRCDGTPVGYEAYTQSILDGFNEIYQLVLTHRDELLKSESILSIFKNQEVRFVFRNTMVYGLTHRYMHQPKFMAEGVTYSIILEQLVRGHLLMEDKSSANAILQAERKSMQELDIPYFTANVNDTSLRFEGREIVSDYFQAPSYLRMLESIQRANENDSFRQNTIIKQSLSARLLIGHHHGDILLMPRTDSEFVPFLSRDEAIQQARQIANQIMQHSIQGVDESLTWIAPLYIPELQIYKVRLLSLQTYDGLTGIAIFFAGLYKVTGETQYRDTCYKILQTVRQQFREQTTRQEALREMGHGIALGYSGIPYTFSLVSRLLDNSDLREQAVDAVMEIDEANLSLEQNLDVFTGVAGACLALIEVFRSTQSEAVLHKATMCGEILLRRYEANRQEEENISNQHTKPMYAFAYGEAGIQETIKRLEFLTEDSRFKKWQNQGDSKFEIAIATANTLSLQKSEKSTCFMPGLFTGLAGFGYRLLHNYDAQLLSNIFLFE
jgi:type 2 lantibiotic biosynthesis protein LanM